MVIPGIILTLLAFVAVLVVAVIGFIVRVILRMMKKELHLDIKIGAGKNQN